MTDPITTLTVTAIADLAFKKFLETAAGEAAKKFTETALNKMDDLRKKIVGRLSGVPAAQAAIAKLEDSAGTKADLETVADYLKIAMREDPQFADELKVIAQEIKAGKIQDNSKMEQNNYDSSTGYQTKIEGGQAFVGGQHYHGIPPQG